VPYHSYLETDAEGLALRRPETDYRLNPDLYLRRPPRRTAFTTERRADGSGNRASEQSPASGTSSAQGKLHLNTATAQELQTLPGIGSVLSAAIVVEREKGDFSSPDDLLRVPGIGAKRLDAIRELITAP
jgi:competence protein ComEA